MQNSYFDKSRKVEFWFMLSTLVVVLMVGMISAHYKLGWKSAWVLSIGMYLIIGAFAFIRNDVFIKKILVFSLAAGTTELLADCWLVSSTKTLIYAANEPMIACSPVYMPFSWAVILTQVGYLGWLVAGKEKLLIATIITGIIGGAVIPLFEHWAKGAKWWYYDYSKMIGNTPYFIALGEVLICAALPFCFVNIFKNKIWLALILGVLEGEWIWVSYFIFFKLFKS